MEGRNVTYRKKPRRKEGLKAFKLQRQNLQGDIQMTGVRTEGGVTSPGIQPSQILQDRKAHTKPRTHATEGKAKKKNPIRENGGERSG